MSDAAIASRREQIYWPAAILLAAAAAVAFRLPQLVLRPRVWAEEGTYFFAYAYAHGPLSMPLARPVGYYSLWQNVASAVASLLSLEHVAGVMTAFAFVAQLLPAVLIVSGRSSWWDTRAKQAAAVACTLLARPSDEIWLNTIGSQYAFSLAALVVLAEDRETRGAARALRLAVLCVGGLTGVATCLLAPAFVWAAVRRRRRDLIAGAAILAACALVQLNCVRLGIAERNDTMQQRSWSVTPDLFGVIVTVKELLVPFLGDRAADFFAQKVIENPVAGAWLGLAGVGVWVALVVWAAGERRELALGLAFLVFASVFGSLGDKRYFIRATLGARYFYAPNAMVAMLLASRALAQGTPLWRRALPGALAAAALGWGVSSFARSQWVDARWPDWRAEVALFRQDPRYEPRIWPPGWKVHLAR